MVFHIYIAPSTKYFPIIITWQSFNNVNKHGLQSVNKSKNSEATKYPRESLGLVHRIKKKNVKRPVIISHTRSHLLILTTDSSMLGLGITEKLKGLY